MSENIHYNWKAIFLTALADLPVVSTACTAAGISRVSAYNERRTDKAFEAAWNEALEAGIDKAEAEGYRRAVTGYTEPLTHQGQISFELEQYQDEDGHAKVRYALDPAGNKIPITIRKHSDQLLQFYLKGRRRGIYGDKQELTGADGGALAVVDETQKAARLAALFALATSRRDRGSEPEDLSDLA